MVPGVQLDGLTASFDSVEFLMPPSPRNPPITDDSDPAPTQATLVASPRAEEKETTPSSRAARARQPPPSSIPASSQITLAVTQERVAVQRTRRGPIQPGTSVPVGPASARDAPYRNTRARSRSVEPQPATSRWTREEKGKGKAKQELGVVSENEHTREENRYPEEVAPVTLSGSLPTKETLEDEMDVEDLLEEASVSEDIDAVDYDSLALPRTQEIADADEPSDSDDAETHRSLRPFNREGSAKHESGDDMGSESGGSSSEDDNEDDDRLQRMANASLVQARTSPEAAPPSRVTRSMTHLAAHVTPRQTRGTQDHTREPQFPSPGTRAWEVVDQINQKKRMLPYTPPRGSKAAGVVKVQRG
jgi:hypothetical protein